MEKFKLSSNVLAICLTSFLGLLLLTSTFKNRNRSNDLISVTGLGTKDFESDLVTWTASFTRMAPNIQEAYRALQGDRERIKNFLVKNGVPESDFKFSSVATNKEYEESYDPKGFRHSSLKGHRLSQSVTIESKEVDKIESLSREVTELLNQGVELSSSVPQYFYTKLPELKLEMIAQAARDGRMRAEKIAQEAGSKITGVRFASTGVFQITARNSNEDFSWGGTYNTQAKKKKASVTMKIQFGVR